MYWVSLVLVLIFELAPHLRLHNLLLLFQSASVDLVYVFTIGDFLLTAIRVLFVLSDITVNLTYFTYPNMALISSSRRSLP